MADDVQPSEPPDELLAVATRVVPAWLERVTSEASRRGGVDPTGNGDEFDTMIERVARGLLGRLAELLSTDVDAQRTTPLSLCREAILEPTEWLRASGVQPPPVPPDTSFPDDIYRLGPATWADIDPAMHEPGLMWGAWKAATVMARRRDEGLR